MKPQEWSFLAAVGATLLTLWSGLRFEPVRAVAWLLVAAGCWALSRHYNRKRPIPFPYALRWLLRLPRPFQSSRDLLRILQPQRGERLLEIGPGVGTHALRVASTVAPGGTVHVLDVRHEMARDVVRRAHARNVANLVGCTADAARLPYGDATFDGAYLISVLGEVPDAAAALQELLRVLKPAGRLVVGELLIDPDFVSSRRVRQWVEQAGFVFRHRTGPRAAYLVRFERSAT